MYWMVNAYFIDNFWLMSFCMSFLDRRIAGIQIEVEAASDEVVAGAEVEIEEGDLGTTKSRN